MNIRDHFAFGNRFEFNERSLICIQAGTMYKAQLMDEKDLEWYSPKNVIKDLRILGITFEYFKQLVEENGHAFSFSARDAMTKEYNFIIRIGNETYYKKLEEFDDEFLLKIAKERGWIESNESIIGKAMREGEEQASDVRKKWLKEKKELDKHLNERDDGDTNNEECLHSRCDKLEERIEKLERSQEEEFVKKEWLRKNFKKNFA